MVGLGNTKGFSEEVVWRNKRQKVKGVWRSRVETGGEKCMGFIMDKLKGDGRKAEGCT